MTYAFFTSFDKLVSGFLSFIPFFGILKMGLYFYMFHPQTQGALVIYSRFIEPFLKSYEKTIDSNLENIEKTFDTNIESKKSE